VSTLHIPPPSDVYRNTPSLDHRQPCPESANEIERLVLVTGRGISVQRFCAVAVKVRKNPKTTRRTIREQESRLQVAFGFMVASPRIT
jgi:hypothetical protein